MLGEQPRTQFEFVRLGLALGGLYLDNWFVPTLIDFDHHPLDPPLVGVEVHHFPNLQISVLPLLVLLLKLLYSILIRIQFLFIHFLLADFVNEFLQHARLLNGLVVVGLPAEGADVFVFEGFLDAGEAEGVAAVGEDREDHDFEADWAVELLGSNDG